MSVVIRILGLDPGLRRMGWGAIDSSGSRLTYVAHGVIATDASDELGVRLAALYSELTRAIDGLRPNTIAIEQAFVHRDPSAALKLRQTLPIAVLAGAQAGPDNPAYAPNPLK